MKVNALSLFCSSISIELLAELLSEAYRTKWRLKNAVSLMLQGFKRGQRL